MARKSKKDEELSEHSEDGTPMEETIKEEEGEEEEQQQGEDEEMEEAGEEEEELILNDDKLEIVGDRGIVIDLHNNPLTDNLVAYRTTP